MFSFSVSAQSLAHRLNKSTAALLTAPIKGYTGACPFLRGLSTISSNPHGGQPNLLENDNPKMGPLCADNSCAAEPADNQLDRNRLASGGGGGGGLTCNGQPESRDRRSQQTQQRQDSPDESMQVRQTDHQATRWPAAQLATRNIYRPEVSSSGKPPPAPISTRKPTFFDYSAKLRELIGRKKDDGSYRIFRKVRRFSSSFPHGTEQGRPVTIWCSNDYFGMSSHPKVLGAVAEALNEYGAGSGGTRNIAGNSPVHEQLEWELADLHRKEAALLFSSCFVANDSSLYTLLKLMPGCQVFSDAGNHASMIQGIRNSGAPKHIFRQFDAADLEAKLKRAPVEVPKIVAFETVHSMTGDISDVERMCDIAHKYGALTFVDEVHAVGLYGERGAGIAERDACMDKIDIVSGTLGKAYGNCGGYIASSAELVDVIRSYAAGFIFTTSLPPTIACGATESVRILKGDEGRYLRQLQQDNVFHMKRSLTAAGLPHYHSKSHIIPIPVGDPTKCTRVSADLLDLGHYIQSINYPTVPKGTERLRVSVTPFHNEQMIDSLIEKLVSVWKRNELSFMPPVELPNQCLRHQMKGQRDTRVGQSLWCHACHKEMDFCTKLPDNEMIVN